MTRCITIILAAALVTGMAPAAEDRSRLTGSWEFNRAESDFGSRNSQKAQKATLNITLMKDTVRIAWTGIEPNGKQESGETTLLTDGRVHPSDAPATTGVKTYTARWDGDNLVLDKTGNSWTEEDVFTVSADGKKMTMDRVHRNGINDSRLKFVHDRVNADKSSVPAPDSRQR